MYVPDHFKEDDQEKLHRYIRDYAFGLLVVADNDGIEANHLPFYLITKADDSPDVLQCHLARSNPVWRRLQNGAEVLAVFKGPDAYISPSLYATKAETGQVVPTWNYLAVHAQGQAQIIQDPAWLKQHLHQLIDQHESGREEPWSMDDAPADYTAHLMQAIVGVEITITSLTGKLKASQNQPERNKPGVKAGLEVSQDVRDLAMAKLIN